MLLSRFIPSIIILLFIAFVSINNQSLHAQEPANPMPLEGTIRGKIIDRVSKKPLTDGFVELLNFSPRRVVRVDTLTGHFEFKFIPIGRHRLVVRVEGYEEAYEMNINVVAGSEQFMTLQLTEKIVGVKDPLKQQDIGVGTTRYSSMLALRQKDPFILMDNTIGEQRFNIEQMNNFAGSRNDPARMASNFSGISNADDTRNDIVVRGGTPLGVQWLLEGLPINNPNHLGLIGTTSGYFPILNVNVIGEGDFRLGAFSSQYANTTTGIFDIHLRNPETKRLNTTAQLGWNGAELVLQGPLFSKRTSFIIAGRYSILPFFNTLGIYDFNAKSMPRMYDINFNFQYVTKIGNEFNIFGFHGNSTLHTKAVDEEFSNIFNPAPRADVDWENNNTVLGVKYRHFFSNNFFWQTTVGGNRTYNNQEHTYYKETIDGLMPFKGLYSRMFQTTFSLSTFVNNKVNTKLSWRGGLMVQHRVNEFLEMHNRYNISPAVYYNDLDNNQFMHFYAHANYRLMPDFSLQIGAAALYNNLNKQFVAEPRLNLSWDIAEHHQLDIIYTLQHQEISTRISYLQLPIIDPIAGITTYDRSARDLKMMANHYFMLEYAYQPKSHIQFKLSPYYKMWFDIPVQANELSGYSVFNVDSRLPYNLPKFPLKSTGTAENYGIDFTAIYHLNKGLQINYTFSYFNASYTGSDGIKRNARFDRDWLTRLSASKEWILNKLKGHSFFASTTFTVAQGERYTPIDQVQSAYFNDEILTNQWFENRTPMYMRWDFKVGFRLNTKKLTQYFYIDVTNVLGRKNVLTYHYDTDNLRVTPIYQYGRMPELFYRIQF